VQQVIRSFPPFIEYRDNYPFAGETGCSEEKPGKGSPRGSWPTDRESQLDRFFHQARSQASRADSEALGRAVHECADDLKVRGKNPLRFVVGMADIMPGLMSLAAEITPIGHSHGSFCLRSALVVCKRAVCYHRPALVDNPAPKMANRK